MLLVLTACSSKTPSEFSSSRPSTTPTPTTTAPAPPPDLLALGLAVTDLPTGWTGTSDATAVSLGQAGCLDPAARRDGAIHARYFTFAGSGGSPIFAESLAFHGDGKGEAQYQDGQKALDGCSTVDIKAGRYTFSGPIQAMSFPTLGTRSKAYVISAKYRTHSLTEYVLLTQVNDILIMTSYAGVKDVSITNFLAYSEKAIAKVTGTGTPGASTSPTPAGTTAATGSASA